MEKMIDKFDTWQMELTTVTWEFDKLLKGLDAEALNYHQPSSWSIAENLSHLIQLNSSYFPLFEQIILGTYKPTLIAKVKFLANPIGNMLYGMMTSKRKVKTMQVWYPVASTFDLGIINDFSNHQMDLARYLERLEPHFDKNIIIPSPANRFLVYPLDRAIDIIIAHENRHLEQCRTIVADIKQQEPPKPDPS